MSQPKTFRAGDSCPNCGGAVDLRRAPTADERADAARPDHSGLNPYLVDTAPSHVIEEFGALHVCPRCGFSTRVPVARP